MKTQVMTCRFCDRECAMVVTLDAQGRPVSLRPQHETGTVSCPTGLHALELMGNPRRVVHPLRRTGPRGSGKWETLSWEEALDWAAGKLRAALDRDGPESLLFIKGFNKPLQGAVFDRLANLLGVPNRLGAGNMCHQAQAQSFVDTFGFPADRRITSETRTVVLWGSNPSNTMRWVQRDIAAMKRSGGRLVVIDPLPTRMTQIADLWLPIRPGTDAALALGWMRLILTEGWEDRALLERWSSGLDEVRAACRPYTLEYTARLTGLPAEQIRLGAEWFARSGPAILYGGNALDHNWDSYQKGRCLAILLALAGQVDRPGAALHAAPASPRNPIRTSRLTCADRFTPAQRQQMAGWDEALLPSARQTSGQAMLRAIEAGRLKAGWVLGGDPVMMWADSRRVARVLSQLDFFMVQDFFLTPTARIADLVLPVATYLEYENVFFQPGGAVQYRPALVTGSNARSDMDIVNEMGNRLGLSADFWPDMEAFWDFLLEESGVTLDQLRTLGRLEGDGTPAVPVPRGYRETGFPTADGTIHLSIPALSGGSVPSYRPLPEPGGRYPDRCTNYKAPCFFHSAGRQMAGQRAAQPEPLAYVSADVAAREGLSDGDWARVATSTGSVRQRVQVRSDMARGTVALAIGWWEPEEPSLERALDYNCNNLTSDAALLGGEIQAFSCRGIPCRVEKFFGK